jgi:hypothetical protein
MSASKGVYSIPTIRIPYIDIDLISCLPFILNIIRTIPVWSESCIHLVQPVLFRFMQSSVGWLGVNFTPTNQLDDVAEKL